MVKNLKKKKGFTLIELIIVIAILGILAAIAIPKFGDVQANARKKADISSAKTIADTAAVLIADEKIKVGTADATTSTTVGGYGAKLSLSAVGGSGYLIANALQSVPTPKVKGSSFVIDIDQTTGVIKVFATDGTTPQQVYPTADTPWQ